jgi:hypothetical protein
MARKAVMTTCLPDIMFTLSEGRVVETSCSRDCRPLHVATGAGYREQESSHMTGMETQASEMRDACRPLRCGSPERITPCPHGRGAGVLGQSRGRRCGHPGCAVRRGRPESFAGMRADWPHAPRERRWQGRLVCCLEEMCAISRSVILARLRQWSRLSAASRLPAQREARGPSLLPRRHSCGR